jgi:hypothetical protein
VEILVLRVFWIQFSEFSCVRSHGSAVGIAIGYGLEDRKVELRVPLGSIFFSTPPRTVLGVKHARV